jgi:hypothetical protein
MAREPLFNFGVWISGLAARELFAVHPCPGRMAGFYDRQLAADWDLGIPLADEKISESLTGFNHPGGFDILRVKH